MLRSFGGIALVDFFKVARQSSDLLTEFAEPALGIVTFCRDSGGIGFRRFKPIGQWVGLRRAFVAFIRASFHERRTPRALSRDSRADGRMVATLVPGSIATILRT
jgi:hypothetical protein